jgi:hypothetical protein
MSRRHHPPAQLRYLKARLWNLARPGFWGTAIFLSVVGLVIKEYWTHPEFFTQWQRNQAANQSTNSYISQEDRSIAADIDNLPVLYNTDSDQKTSLATTPDPKQETQAKNSKGLLEALNSKNPKSASDAQTQASVKENDSVPAQKLENPFVAQAENLLQLPKIQTGSTHQVNTLTPSFNQQNPFDLATQLAEKTRPNQNLTSQSALQTAIDQSKSQNQPNLNSTTSTQINPFKPSQLSPDNAGAQNLVPSTGSSRNTTNPLTTGTNTPQSGQIAGTNYTQSGFQNIPQNRISGTSYPQQGLNNLFPQNPTSIPGYTQPGVTNFPQNTISGTSYPQQGLNNLFPQNPIPVPGYPQQGITNQLQTPISRTSYPQPQPGLVGIPQTPSAVPNRSLMIYNRMMRDRLNNINSTQLPNVAQPTFLAPPTSTISPNIAPYSTPQNQGVVNYNTPLIPNNYGNSVLQQAPAPVLQNIDSNPRQIPGQSTGTGQINRY